jgi:hypothetical protein
MFSEYTQNQFHPDNPINKVNKLSNNYATDYIASEFNKKELYKLLSNNYAADYKAWKFIKDPI